MMFGYSIDANILLTTSVMNIGMMISTPKLCFVIVLSE